MILQKKTFRTEKGICKVELVKKGAEYIVKVDGDIYKKPQMSFCSTDL